MKFAIPTTCAAFFLALTLPGVGAQPAGNAQSAASPAKPGLASGQIFGIQIGELISMSQVEAKKAARDRIGTFVRKQAEKPDDIQYLQIYTTPKTHIVTMVDGASEFRTRKAADAFVAKYAALLPQVSTEFKRMPGADGETPLALESPNWRLSIEFTDMSVFQRSGYMVRISLKPAFGGPLDYLTSQAFEERKELQMQDERDAHARARDLGELKGIR